MKFLHERPSLGIISGALLALSPLFVFAQTSGGATAATYITATISFFNGYVIPFIIALAFLIFIWGIARFFIFNGGSDEARENGKRLAFWGIIAFILIVSIWGLVNALATGFGVAGGTTICPDYMKNCSAGSSAGGGATSGGNTTGTSGNNTPTNPYSTLIQGSSQPSTQTQQQTFPTSGSGRRNQNTLTPTQPQTFPASGSTQTVDSMPAQGGGTSGGGVSTLDSGLTTSESGSVIATLSAPDPSGAETLFNFTGSGNLGNFSLSNKNMGTRPFEGLAPGNYSITSVTPNGWRYAGTSCSGADSWSRLSSGAMITLKNGDTFSCTFSFTHN